MTKKQKFKRLKYLIGTSFMGLAVGLSACSTTQVVSPAELTNKRNAPLINRSEVVAVVSSVDVATDLEQSALRWGYELKRKESLDGLGLWVLTFDCPPGIDPRDASLELERLQPRATVEANHKFLLQSAVENQISQIKNSSRQYANKLINWPDEGCEALFRIGMIDGAVKEDELTGIDLRLHSEDFIRTPASDAAMSHGTAVAELLVGRGRLRNTELYAASVVEQDQTGVTYSGAEPILRALDWMVRQDVKLVNISLAGPYNETLAKGFDRASEKGVIIVAAVGNDGPDAGPRYPAALDSVLAATAVNSEGEIYPKAVTGNHIDVAAPGVEVFVQAKSGGRYVSGTSIAAPFVTAQLALLPNDNADFNVDQARSYIKSMAVDLGDGGHDPIYGAGLITMVDPCDK